jgi:hypothetical protein
MDRSAVGREDLEDRDLPESGHASQSETRADGKRLVRTEARGGLSSSILALQRSAGNRAVSQLLASRDNLATVPPGGGADRDVRPRREARPGRRSPPAAPQLQRVLVDVQGKRLRDWEVFYLIEEYGDDDGELRRHHEASDPFRVTALREGLRFTPYGRPPSKFVWHKEKGLEYTLGTQSVHEARAAHELHASFERTPMRQSLTPQIASGLGDDLTYRGSKEALSQGLKPAGLARNHHLSDSAITTILSWLRRNREVWSDRRVWVWRWMQALTYAVDPHVEEIFNRLWFAGTIDDLRPVVDRLSNNPRNVGIGSAEANRRIGPTFDESLTPGGFSSPTSSLIAQFTRGLERAGVPREIVDAALTQLVDTQTGEILTSMVVSAPAWSQSPPRGRRTMTSAMLDAPPPSPPRARFESHGHHFFTLTAPQSDPEPEPQGYFTQFASPTAQRGSAPSSVSQGMFFGSFGSRPPQREPDIQLVDMFSPEEDEEPPHTAPGDEDKMATD